MYIRLFYCITIRGDVPWGLAVFESLLAGDVPKTDKNLLAALPDMSALQTHMLHV